MIREGSRFWVLGSRFWKKIASHLPSCTSPLVPSISNLPARGL